MDVTPFKPGFRIDGKDILVLAGGFVLAYLAGRQVWWMGLIVGFSIGHFFLFCNVFRVDHPLELAWAALFVAMAGGTILLEQPGWLFTVFLSLAATFAVLVLQMRKPSYHGIAWQRLNPDLPSWWAARAGVPPGAGSPMRPGEGRG